MAFCVAYEEEIGHPDAQKDAARAARVAERVAERVTG
jgi:hypothetical protein